MIAALSQQAGTTVSLPDLIDRIVAPPEPAPVSMFPQTWGWAVLLALVVAAAAWFAWRRWRAWRADAYRRAALAEIDAAGDDPARIAAILRRAALAAWPRDAIAPLSGEEWLEFLDGTAPGSGFGNGAGRLAATGPYAPVAESSPDFARLARDWVRLHRRPA